MPDQDPSQGNSDSGFDPMQVMQMMGIQPGGTQQIPQGMPPQMPMGQPPMPPIGMNSPGYTPQAGTTNVLAPGNQSLANANPKQINALKDPKNYLQAISNPMGFITQLAAHGLMHLIKSVKGDQNNPLANTLKAGMDKTPAQSDGSSNDDNNSNDQDNTG